MSTKVSLTNQPPSCDTTTPQNTSVRRRHNASNAQNDTLTSLQADSKTATTSKKKEETLTSFLERLQGEQYPSKLMEALEACTSRCRQSPVLELGYRNFETLKPEDMQQPIMGVTTYTGQIGIALHIRGKLEKTVDILQRVGYKHYVWIPDVNNVLIIFKDPLSTTSTSWTWSYKWGLNDNRIIERIYLEEHLSQKESQVSKLEGMDKCSRDSYHIDRILVDVLTGKGDTTFILESNEPPSFFQSVWGAAKKNISKLLIE